MNPVAIVTTNYDEILEALLDDRCRLFERHDEARLPLRNKIGVWHVHGSVRRPEDIVITTEDYLEFFRPGSYEQTKLAQLLHDFTTVFVGYSMSDINLLTALDWAQNVYRTTNGPSKHGRIDESDSNAPRQIIVEYDSRKESPETARIERPATALIQCSNVIRFLDQITQVVHGGTMHDARNLRGNSGDPNGRKRRALSEETISKALQERHNMSSEDADLLAHIAQGSYTEALKRMQRDTEQQQFFDLFIQLMRHSYARRVKELQAWSLSVAELGRERQKRMLEYFQGQLRENFIYNFHQPQINFLGREEENFSTRFAPFINERNVVGIMNELSDAGRDIAQNVSARMVFFDLALKMIVLLKNG